MPRLDVIYRDGHKESEYCDTIYDAMESGKWRLTWEGVECVEIYDKYGDLRASQFNW